MKEASLGDDSDTMRLSFFLTIVLTFDLSVANIHRFQYSLLAGLPVRNQIGNAIAWWREMSAVQPNDSRMRSIYRFLLRFGGIALVFVLSPVLVLAIVFLAFFTV